MKDNIIKLCSRYNENNYLEPFDSNNNDYILRTEHDNIRMGYTKDNNLYIDPAGGPMIIENNKLLEVNRVVKSITHRKGVGFIITFK